MFLKILGKIYHIGKTTNKTPVENAKTVKLLLMFLSIGSFASFVKKNKVSKPKANPPNTYKEFRIKLAIIAHKP